MSLWNKKNKETLLGPLSKNNPIMVQMLGICSALAVTSKLEPAIVMALSVTVVVAFSNVVISLLRRRSLTVSASSCSSSWQLPW